MNPGSIVAYGRQLYQQRFQVKQFLDFTNQEKRGFAGSVNAQELERLRTLVEVANKIDGPIVEIGTLFGFTTQHIAEWKNPDKPLITVDNFRWNPIGLSPEAHKHFTHRCLHYAMAHGSTSVFDGSNIEFYNSFKGPRPAMVFIDAGHSYEDVIVDIRWAIEQQIPIISGHDYSPQMPGVCQAVDEAFGKGAIELGGSVWSASTVEQAQV